MGVHAALAAGNLEPVADSAAIGIASSETHTAHGSAARNATPAPLRRRPAAGPIANELFTAQSPVSAAGGGPDRAALASILLAAAALAAGLVCAGGRRYRGRGGGFSPLPSMARQSLPTRGVRGQAMADSEADSCIE